MCVCVERAGSGAGFRHYNGLYAACRLAPCSFVRPPPHPTPHPTPHRGTPGGEERGVRSEEVGRRR